MNAITAPAARTEPDALAGADAIDALAQIRLESDLWWMWVCGMQGVPGPAIPAAEVFGPPAGMDTIRRAQA